MASLIERVAEEVGRLAEGGVYQLTGSVLECVVDGHRVRIERGEQGMRIKAFFAVSLDLGLMVSSRTFGLVDGLEGQLRFGDSDWDDEVHGVADEPERAKTLLDGELRGQIQHLNAYYLRVRIDDHAVAAFSEFAESACVKAVREAITIAQGVERRRVRLQPAALLAQHAANLETFARANDLALMLTPLSLEGMLGGASVRAHFLRSESGVILFELLATPVEPGPERGLRVRPTTLGDRAAIFFGGEDIRAGEALFDKAFRVECTDTRHAETLLDEPTRKLLMDLASVSDEFNLGDNSLLMRSTATRFPSDRIVATVVGAAAVTARAARVFTGRDGPYR
jgi:hypothetical protein